MEIVLYIFLEIHTFISVNEIGKKLKNSKFGIMVTSEKEGVRKEWIKERVYEMWSGSQDISSVALDFTAKNKKAFRGLEPGT